MKDLKQKMEQYMNSKELQEMDGYTLIEYLLNMGKNGRHLNYI